MSGEKDGPGEMKDASAPQTQRKYQMEGISWINELLYLWVTPTMQLGASRPLEYDDIDELPPNLRMPNVDAIVEESWLTERQEKEKAGQKPQLSTALRKAFIFRYIISAFWSLPYCCAVLAQPYLITKVFVSSMLSFLLYFVHFI